jgi:hypothetical protein
VERETIKSLGNKVGLAALALLLPGGLIVGGALAYREYRKRAAEADSTKATP